MARRKHAGEILRQVLGFSDR